MPPSEIKRRSGHRTLAGHGNAVLGGAVERRPLPGTPFEISVVGFGSWAIGGEYWGPADDETSVAAIHAALDAGINWFDTAPIYGSGHSDTLLARALRGVDDVLVFTKVGPRPDLESGHVVSDLTPANIIRDCDESLARLELERIALLQVHWPCQLGTPLDESIGALDELVQCGKIEHYGLCNYDAGTFRQARQLGHIATLQTPYSMIRREFDSALRDAVGEGPIPAGVLVYETMCRGLLTGKYGSVPPQFADDDLRSHDVRFQPPVYGRIFKLNQALAVIARKLGIPHAALPVGWAITRPGVTAAIIGGKTAAQVRETARAAELTGRKRVWEVIERYAAQVRI